MALTRRLIVCGVLRDVYLQFILINAGDSRGLHRYLPFDVGMDAYQGIQLFVHHNLTRIYILTVFVRVAPALWLQAQDSLLVALCF